MSNESEKATRIFQANEVHDLVKATANKAWEIIKMEISHAPMQQQMLICGRIVLFIFHTHFQGIEFIAQKKISEESARQADPIREETWP